jgi:hypothetical protein
MAIHNCLGGSKVENQMGQFVTALELQRRIELGFCLIAKVLFCLFIFLAVLVFELRASCLLGRRSYCLSHSSSKCFY